MNQELIYTLERAAASAENPLLRQRCEAVSLRMQGWESVAIAEELGCCVESPRRWEKLFLSQGIDGLCTLKKPGRKPIVNLSNVREVKWVIEASQRRTKPASGEEIIELLASRGIYMSLSSLYNELHRLDFSYKTCRPVHPKRDEAEVAQWKAEFPEVLKNVQKSHPDRNVKVMFEDETRFGMQGILTRQWSPVGERPSRERQVEYANAWIFGAVCPETGQHHMLVSSHAATDFMQLFLNFLSRCLGRSVHCLLVLDNAGWHRSEELQVPSNITLHFLPPYAPELNPIENLWQFIKSHLLCNRVFGSVAEIIRSGVHACRSLTNEICASVCRRTYEAT